MTWLPTLIWLALPGADFSLPDSAGKVHSLHDWRDHRVVVIAFLGVECPVARAYAARLSELAAQFAQRGVAIVGVDANPADSAAAIAKLTDDLQLAYPILSDAKQTLARRFAITRQPEVVVLDDARRIRYRGRIDDQFSPGWHKAKASRADLAIALEELLAGRPISVPLTEPAGCPLDWVAADSKATAVTYHRDIAPIVAHRCVGCHQTGGIAPFSLRTAEEARRKATAIREAVADRRMPPWHADRHYGKFANDPSLTETERNLILDWCAAGAPLGDSTMPPLSAPASHGWQIIAPNFVVAIPHQFHVPAQGVIPYQSFEVDPGFAEDRWIQEAEIRPGNRAVVHHATVFLKPPGVDGLVLQGELKSFCLAAYALGTPPMVLPNGMAKKLPAGWRLLFVIHYVPNGREQIDRTQVALRFADARTVEKEVATNILISEEMTIPPHCRDHVETRSRRFDQDVLLLALFPHMHLRGLSFRYEATYPDGHTEVLLSVPKWDMEWQHRYVLSEPKRLPAGTTLTAIGHYDNSAANPNNPDPEAEVHAGPQTTDEMFNGYYDFCLADQDLTGPAPRRFLRSIWWVAAIVLTGVWFRIRQRRS